MNTLIKQKINKVYDDFIGKIRRARGRKQELINEYQFKLEEEKIKELQKSIKL